MRCWMFYSVAAIAVANSPANAADKLQFGPAPAWVSAQSIPPASAKNAEQPVTLLLHDQQLRFEPKAIINYSELAFKIQKSEGLSAGNLSVGWDPATDTLTVNKLEIHRGNQTLDILKSGQTFTTLRRESNLELAMFDGQLTANIQPEGLQVGDVIVLAATIEHVDPVLKGHAEATFAPWADAQIGLAHARLLWPSSIQTKIQKTGDLPTPERRTATDGLNVYELTMHDIEPVIPPKGAPLRYKIGRMGEATDFRSWSDLASLMIPLYGDAAKIPASGPLRDEVEKIRKSSSDPKARAEQALQLVEERVRYVALLMGQGGLVPAPAETTWSRRFGDCKAKTALLLGILHAMNIDAEPLLVQSKFGDALPELLPMLSYFDHVLVRAHIAGKTYYLDGTRTGDREIDGIQVPDFGWGLPLTDNAKLVQLVQPPLDRQNLETKIAIDAIAGIYALASVSVDQLIDGDLAVGMNSGLASISEAQRQQFFEEYWKKSLDDLTVSSTTFVFDKQARQLHLAMKGKMKLDWSGGFFHLPASSLGYTPDLDRSAGPSHDAPFAVSHPVFARVESKIRFPPNFFPANIEKLVPEPVHTTLIGVEYSRVQSATNDSMTVQTTTRSLVPEVSYKEAMAASAALKTLAYGDVSARLPATYRLTSADLPEVKDDMSGSASDIVTRGNSLMENGHFDEAIAAFTKSDRSRTK